MTAKKKTEDGTTKKMTGRSKILPNGAKPIEGISYDYRRERYYVTVYMGKDSKGKPRNKVRTAKTKAEAEAIKAQLEREKAQGKLVPTEPDTLSERTKRSSTTRPSVLARPPSQATGISTRTTSNPTSRTNGFRKSRRRI